MQRRAHPSGIDFSLAGENVEAGHGAGGFQFSLNILDTSPISRAVLELRNCRLRLTKTDDSLLSSVFSELAAKKIRNSFPHEANIDL